MFFNMLSVPFLSLLLNTFTSFDVQQSQYLNTLYKITKTICRLSFSIPLEIIGHNSYWTMPRTAPHTIFSLENKNQEKPLARERWALSEHYRHLIHYQKFIAITRNAEDKLSCWKLWKYKLTQITQLIFSDTFVYSERERANNNFQVKQ